MAVRCLSGMDFDSNIYLLTGEDPILVDAGTGMHHQDILKWLSSIVKKGKVRRIVLTHRHYDHTGGAAALARELGAEVLMHPMDAPAVREGDPRQTLSYMFGIHSQPVEVSELREGQVLTTGESSYEVVHTPGHTSGSISLYDREAKVLLPGDTVFVRSPRRTPCPRSFCPGTRCSSGGSDAGTCRAATSSSSRVRSKSFYP